MTGSKSKKGEKFMKKNSVLCIIILASIMIVSTMLPSSESAEKRNPYNSSPPFKLDALKTVRIDKPEGLREERLYNPVNPYNIFINYELGMHCVGFDISYCCVIPPYNSIQAQAVQSGTGGTLPKLLTPNDKIKLAYHVKDNSYSEGNKMKYWQVLKDANHDGTLGSPSDNMANYVWTHLFIYKDLEGTLPPDWSEGNRLHIGQQIQVNVDSGPSGKHISGGFLTYAGDKGGNIVFTDSLIPAVKNVKLVLTASHIWDALGLPLTAFYDSRRNGTIRSITSTIFQPFQYSTVALMDESGNAITAGDKPVEFFGTNPVDMPNCYLCHSGDGPAAQQSKQEGLVHYKEEYQYWKSNYPDVSEFMARLSQASIDILELHDKHHNTTFLQNYRKDANSNRLGETGSVYCADCHGDNISGNLQVPRAQISGYEGKKARPLTESIHMVHNLFIPYPDKADRTQNCQACHPTHWQSMTMNDVATNPYQILDEKGNPRFSDADQRAAGGGCFLRRDAMTNPHVTPPFFLNAIGNWYFENVSTKDAAGNKISGMRGLVCTNCHNDLTQVLYAFDDLKDPVRQEGKTLRNKSIDDIVQAVAKGNKEKFADIIADPKTQAPGNPLYSFYNEHKGHTLVKSTKDAQGNLKLLAWNDKNGAPVPYEAATGGGDWWLAPSEPHCANCHSAPFVESGGGKYFPIDQPNKYALYRHSKAHGEIACQSCHESIHGLYPVRHEGDEKSVDLTTHQQALQFSPDGEYAGPVSCAACHTVNEKGVPVQLWGTDFYHDYWASLVLMHFMRDDDIDLSIADLIKKFPYSTCSAIVKKGWD
jgi:mono/diheme cytochrome c family protein